MIKPMWDSKAVKAYETGQGVELVNEPYPHYVPSQKKHEWASLTDEEIFEIHKQVDSMQYLTFGKAIEAKLKDKNNG